MFDRDVDMISPFCVNQNYEGLLDEFFGIKACTLSIAAKIVYSDDKTREEMGYKDPNQTIDFSLTNEEANFSHIRNNHFNAAGPHLNKQIKEIDNMMKDKSQKSIEELDNYMKKLRNMNVVKAKEICTSYINIAYQITQA